MKFEPLTLDKIELVKPYYEKIATNTCDFTVGGMFMWREFFKMEYAIEDGVFYSRLHNFHGRTHYNIPLADDIPAAAARLAHEIGDLSFCTVPAEYVPVLEGACPVTEVREQPTFGDYLYMAEDLATLRGKKYSGQRNQISQFTRAVSSWDFKPVTEDKLGELIDFFREKYIVTAGDSPAEREENKRVSEVLENYGLYSMRGGYLTVDGRVAGFTLNERIRDTVFTHVEKAERGMKGAYQMLVKMGAEMFFSEGAVYMNREEDMGDEGLRASKQSYHPIRMLKKYIVEVRK